MLFLAEISIVCAQGGFRRRYYLQNSLTSICKNVIETPSGSLIGLGVTVDTVNAMQVKHLTLIGTDAQGNFQWKKSYGNASIQYYSNIEKGYVDTSGYYQAVPMQGTGPRVVGGLIKFNFQGDTVWQRLYRDPNPLDDLIPYSVTRSVNGGFLMTGFFQNWGAAGYNKLLIIKTDRNGKELWRKKLDGIAPNWQNVIWGYDIVQDSVSKKIVISGFQYLGINTTTCSSYGSVFCFDSNGNWLWQRAFLNVSSDPLSRLISLSDGNFMAVGAACSKFDMWGDCSRRKSAAVKFDINGNLIWDNFYDCAGFFPRFACLHELPNRNILLAGVVDTSSIHNKSMGYSVRLMEVDPNGIMLKSRLIGNTNIYSLDSNEVVLSLFPCNDKGFVLATWYPYATNPRPYGIIKIDSTYCDTTEQYCRDVLTEIKTENRNTQSFELYPNPARGEVFIDLTNPSETIYRVKMFEVSGRLIKEVVLASGEKNSVSLTDVNAGIYFVSLYAEQRCVATKKIVVEE